MDNVTIKNKPLLSIIITVFNSHDKLSACLESVLSQSLEKTEILIIDDASSDNSLEVINQYVGDTVERIKIIKLPENKGPGHARNIGIQNAIGEYVSFIDGDDTVHFNYIKTILKAITSQNTDLIVISYERVTKNKQKCIEKIYPYTKWKNYNKILTVDEYPEITALIEVSCVIKVIKKSILDDHPSIRFPDFKVAEDLHFSLNLYAYIKDAVVLPNALYFYHLHENGLSNNNGLHAEYIKILEETIESYKNYGLYEIRYKELEYVFSIHMFLPNLLKFSKNKNPSNYRSLQELRNALTKYFPNYTINPYLRYEPSFVKLTLKIIDIWPQFLKILI